MSHTNFFFIFLILLQVTGPLPVDRLMKGRYLDVIDEEVPTQAWVASIVENHGGRLKLRYGSAKEPDDFFLFYLSYRLHPPGWAKEHRVIIRPPKCKCICDNCTDMFLEVYSIISSNDEVHLA